MNRFIILSSSAAVACCFANLSDLSAQTKNKPNVLFILADDLGYGDLSCYGQEKFSTPNIDKLALHGIRFTQCYSGTTVSAPSRSSLVTGMHTGHTPIRGNIEVQPEGQFPLPEGTNTIFHLFKKNGYKTGTFGKWGLGFVTSSGSPKNMGVNNFYGYNCQLLAHNYYPDHLWDNDKRIELKGNQNGGYESYSQDLIHSKALNFLDDNKDKPFFMFYPTVIPHAELIVPNDSIIQKYIGKYPEKAYKGNDSGRRKGEYCSVKYPHATFAAMVSRLDVYVGQLISKLKELGIYDNTVVIFASDNGPHLEGGADPRFFNSNGIYRGYKRDLYEGGIRVPMIITWPKHIQEAKETNFMCSFWDLMPTFYEMLNQEKQQNVDGISLLPILTQKGELEEHNFLYFEFIEGNGKQAVRQGNWKLLHLNIRKKNFARYELYNIAADPQEKHNLISKYPKKAEELKEIMKKAHTNNPNWKLFQEQT